MRGSRIKDERIITEIQKFSTHGFMIVFVGFMVSLFVKVFMLQWDIKYWLDTFVIVMAGCLYISSVFHWDYMDTVVHHQKIQ